MGLVLAFTSLAVITRIATEILRSVYNTKRVRETGIGGTQDIAMIGIALTVLWILLAIIFGLIWIGRLQHRADRYHPTPRPERNVTAALVAPDVVNSEISNPRTREFCG